ncbi:MULTISPECIES: hypothetical protein [unclassified Serratia (in: enterobacteria)]|uniref:hypothetical protein n=1 Tax=unclassified Serratia (in: enterobacteria) TaxID=2647522 RepID=UPI0030765628
MGIYSSDKISAPPPYSDPKLMISLGFFVLAVFSMTFSKHNFFAHRQLVMPVTVVQRKYLLVVADKIVDDDFLAEQTKGACFVVPR